MIADILKGIGLGAFYGAQASLYAYISSEDLPVSWKALMTKKFWETFSWTKFGKTVLLGAIVGATTTAYFNVTPDMWIQFTEYTGLPQVPLSLILNFANTGVIIAIDRLTKLVVRRTPLVKAWDALKARVLKLLEMQAKAKAIIQGVPEEAKTPA